MEDSIIIFDLDCLLCNRFVQIVSVIDKKDSTSINYNNDGLLRESKLEHKVLDIQV